MQGSVASLRQASASVDVSIVMPCLNETQSLPACIANAKEALRLIHETLGLSGEIVIADNGSDDGGQLLARALGARVVDVSERGYGAALIGGFRAASGRYLVMGDADGSYDFREAAPMVRRLVEGADLCMGSRFQGGIAPGAMPWKNRYIGNPSLTFILNLFFRTRVSDAHCGLRAVTRDCFDRLALSGKGMEFASEMIIKAALQGAQIAETPATLSKDTRDRPPHLRPWRDGWRHLRYLIMFSPAWAFIVPSAAAALVSLTIWAVAGAALLTGRWETSFFGNYWVVFAASLLTMAHTGLLFSLSSYTYSCRLGYRRPSRAMRTLARWVNLETMLGAGLALSLAGAVILAAVFVYWSESKFPTFRSILPPALGASLLAIGMQNALGGFLLSILNGAEANFMDIGPQARAPGSAPTGTPPSAADPLADSDGGSARQSRAAT